VKAPSSSAPSETPPFPQELTEVRRQFDDRRGFATAGRACFEHHAVRDLAGAAEALRVSEPIVAAEAADGPAFLGKEGQGRMGAHDVAQPPQLAVDGVLAERGAEGVRIEKDIDVFRKALDQVPAFRQARAALEADLVARRSRDCAQGLGDVVVLFDNGRPQPPALKMRRRLENGLLEVGMLEQLHVSGASSTAIAGHAATRRARRIRTGTMDLATPANVP
jgi:hypothetical protein